MANSNEIGQIKQIDSELNKLNATIQKTSENYLTVVKSIEDGNKRIKDAGISFQVLNTAQKETTKTTQQLDAVGKQLASSEEKLKQIQDKRTESIVKNRIETRNSTREINQKIRAQQAEKGSIEQLSAVNSILESRLRKVNLSTEEGRKRAELYRSAINRNNKTIKDNSSALGAQRVNVGNYTESIKEAFAQTGLFGKQLQILSSIQRTVSKLTIAQATAQEAATTATLASSKALQILKVALISTGIGALLVALGSLVAFFKASEEGATALAKVLSPFKILFGNLKDLFIGFGKSLYDAFSDPKQAVSDLWEAIKTNIVNRITGLINTFGFLGKAIKSALDLDFEGVEENTIKAGDAIIQIVTGVEDAWGKASKAVGEFIDETKKENEQNIQLQDSKLALIKREREAKIELARLEVEIRDARLKAYDEENLTNEQRLKFAEQAQEGVKRQVALEDELAQKRFEHQQLENSFSTSSQDDLDKEVELQVNLINVQAEGAKKLTTIESFKQGILRKIDSERQAEIKAHSDERIAIAEGEDEILKVMAKEFDNYLKELGDKEFEDFKKKEKKKLEAAKERAEAEKELERDLQRAKEELLDIGVSTLFDINRSANEEKIDQLNEQKEKELDNKNLTEEQKAAIEKKYADQEENLRKKQKTADKLQSAIEVGINAAKSLFQIKATAAVLLANPITAALAPLALAQIPFVLASAGVALAGIAAYSKGTKNAEKRFVAGEDGRELLMLKSGEMIMADKPTYFEGNKFKGARVFSNAETEKIIASNDRSRTDISVYADGQLLTEIRGLRKDMKRPRYIVLNKQKEAGTYQFAAEKERILNKMING